MSNITNYLVVDVENNVDILSTTDCCGAVEQMVTSINNSIKAELFFELNDQWYGWIQENGFVGGHPKTPPTRTL